MAASDKVKAWIADNFEMDAVKVEPFELVPGGHTVTDSKGEQILVWYDFIRDRIEYKERPK